MSNKPYTGKKTDMAGTSQKDSPAAQNKSTEIFRDAPVPKAVISNIIPSIVSMIMVLVYNLADTFFIGIYGGSRIRCHTGLPDFHGGRHVVRHRRHLADIPYAR